MLFFACPVATRMVGAGVITERNAAYSESSRKGMMAAVHALPSTTTTNSGATIESPMQAGRVTRASPSVRLSR